MKMTWKGSITNVNIDNNGFIKVINTVPTNTASKPLLIKGSKSNAQVVQGAIKIKKKN